MTTPSVKQSGQNTTTSVTLTSPVVNNYIVICATYGSTSVPTTPTDTAGNSYTAVNHVIDATNSEEQYIWLAKVTATTGSNIVTATGSVGMIAAEIQNCTGLDGASAPSTPGSTTTISMSTTSSSGNGVLLIAVTSGFLGNGNVTATTGTMVQAIQLWTLGMSSQAVVAGTNVSSFSYSAADTLIGVAIGLAGTSSAVVDPPYSIYYIRA